MNPVRRGERCNPAVVFYVNSDDWQRALWIVTIRLELTPVRQKCILQHLFHPVSLALHAIEQDAAHDLAVDASILNSVHTASVCRWEHLAAVACVWLKPDSTP